MEAASAGVLGGLETCEARVLEATERLSSVKSPLSRASRLPATPRGERPPLPLRHTIVPLVLEGQTLPPRSRARPRGLIPAMRRL